MIERLSKAIGARYLVEELIGQGGMALVFRATERQSRRLVAVKVLHPELASQLIRDRFLQEVKLTSQITHPQSVPILEAGEADGLLYYVMPHFGESLRERLDRQGRLTAEASLTITRDVAEVLAFAHSREIIHRDIKPANILLTDDRAVVADFGIAKAICASCGPRITQTGLSLGSPGYMSPEQAMGSVDVDARTDVFSLGAVLYETLTGARPVFAPGLGDGARLRPGAIPEAHRRYLGEAPQGIEELRARMLAWDPRDRPASAKVVARELARLHPAGGADGGGSLRRRLRALIRRFRS